MQSHVCSQFEGVERSRIVWESSSEGLPEWPYRRILPYSVQLLLLILQSLPKGKGRIVGSGRYIFVLLWEALRHPRFSVVSRRHIARNKFLWNNGFFLRTRVEELTQKTDFEFKFWVFTVFLRPLKKKRFCPAH